MGAVPVFIGYDGIILPKFPDGDPALDDLEFNLGTTKFTIDKTW